MKYNKLVRDKIPEIIEKDGKVAICKVISDEEKKVYLKEKLQEEVQEFLESDDIKELADIFEVIVALAKTLNFDEDSLLFCRYIKAAKRGAFEDNIVLLEVKEK